MDNKWNYIGTNSKGEAKFKRYTEETLEFVKDCLDSKGIAYFVHEAQNLIFIYKEKEPESRYSSRYSYYYTTGRWGNDRRKKHYHCEGIEHFLSKYYQTAEEEKKYWDSIKEKETE